MAGVSLWVVPQMHSFISARLGLMCLTNRCVNGAWQGVGHYAIYVSGSGCAVLAAPFCCRVISCTGLHLNAAAHCLPGSKFYQN